MACMKEVCIIIYQGNKYKYNVFISEEAEADKQRACDSLLMCIVTTLNQGLRNGGGIGDVLRKPGSTVSVPLQSLYNAVANIQSRICGFLPDSQKTRQSENAKQTQTITLHCLTFQTIEPSKV